MNNELRELYQDIILDHGRHPRNFGELAGATHHAHGHNPLCGDTVTVFLIMGSDGRVQRVTFMGHGCAISMASASMMTEVAVGKTEAEVEAIFGEFQNRAKGDLTHAAPKGFEDEIERLDALTGVSAYPSRVKCAVLPWHAMRSALADGAEVTSDGGKE
ncbi:MAG: SUF system NifU family Fe-S cluster assembly protein [Candidatus Pacebacteria bacterium]|nr:SUF system NifU family Fe-S cluster assembly protein [Candidatus Paceibacterota bacterium]